jgi:5-methyltetrahydropteroyltriglutamate--homocysteine methyltransferase
MKGSKVECLSLGVINGRNIWKTDLSAAIEMVEQAVKVLGTGRLMIGSSCSLLHSPHSLEAERKGGSGVYDDDEELLEWLAFAVEKVREVVVVSRAVNEGRKAVEDELKANAVS